MMMMQLTLLLLLVYWLGLSHCFHINDGEHPGLRVALHAQVSPRQGFVVGSVITTAGT